MNMSDNKIDIKRSKFERHRILTEIHALHLLQGIKHRKNKTLPDILVSNLLLKGAAKGTQEGELIISGFGEVGQDLCGFK